MGAAHPDAAGRTGAADSLPPSPSRRGGPRRCPVCGISIEGRRRQALYCSGACRAHASRVRDAIGAKFDPERACTECGEPLAGRRSDALYCGTTCRVTAHKRRAAESAQSRSHEE